MITLEKYIQILNAGYSLDILYLLKLIKEGIDITDELLHPKIAAINQMLLRKELICENGVTLSGDELLSYLGEDTVDRKIVKRIKSEGFDKWWQVYPATNMFSHKGKTFTGTQSKRIKKPECKILFAKYVNEGMPAEDIIAATEFHITTAKDESYKQGKNQLSYIANSHRYLNEKMFEPYIELYKQSAKVQEYDGVNI